jgi:hypothetical protein
MQRKSILHSFFSKSTRSIGFICSAANDQKTSKRDEQIIFSKQPKYNLVKKSLVHLLLNNDLINNGHV